MFLRKWVQAVVKFKWPVIALWVILAVFVYFKAPILSQVAKTDQESFLPADSETVKVSKMLKELYPGRINGSSITIVESREEGINAGDRNYGKELESYLLKNKNSLKISSVTSPFANSEMEETMISGDKKAALLRVDLTTPAFLDESNGAVRTIRKNIEQNQGLNGIPHIPKGLSINVTGDAALGQEQVDNVQRSMDLTGKITVLLVILILIIIYRSPVAPILPLFTIGLSFLISRGVIAWMTYLGLKVSSFTETFLIAVLFGAGTDYCLLLISRYREEIMKEKAPGLALEDAFPSTSMAIICSGGTVIIGFVFMFLAKFGLYNTTGPSIAVGVGITIISVLTLTPAFIAVLGERIFWPVKPSKDIGSGKESNSFWNKLSIIVTSKAVTFIVICTVILLPFMISAKYVSRTFDQLGELPPKSDTVNGFNVIKKHFNQGEMLPIRVVLKSNSNMWSNESLQVIDDVAGNILKVDGVTRVRTATRPVGEQINEISLPNQIDTLSKGLHTVSEGFNPIISGIDKMNGGISTISNNLEKGSSGLNILADKTYEVSSGMGKIEAGLVQLSSGEKSAIETLEKVNKGMKDISDAMSQFKGGMDFADSSLQTAKSNLDELLKQKPDLINDKNFQTAYGTISILINNLPSMNSGVQKIQEGIAGVYKGTTGSGNGLKSIKSGIDESKTALTQIAEGLNIINRSQRQASRDLLKASQYLNLIGSGLKPSKDGIARLKSGISQINDSTRSYVLNGNRLGGVFYLPEGALTKYPELKSAMEYYITPAGNGVNFDVILSIPPYSERALDSISKIDDAVRFSLKGTPLEKAEFHIGGATAANSELRDITAGDFVKVMIFVLLGIFIVLGLLLRSFIAPIYLIITILFSFATTMGITCLVFQKWIGEEGLSWAVPFFSFCILVALGVDYNIFLMTRVKEEYVPGDVAGGTARALASTGKIITSCGIIMAGTFGAMMVSPVTQLVQIGFTTVIGLLLDTFVIRCLLVPAIAVKVGELNWWPGRRIKVISVEGSVSETAGLSVGSIDQH